MLTEPPILKSPNTSTIWRNALIMIFITIIAQFVFNAIIARLLNPTLFGQFSIIVQLMGFLSMPCSVGTFIIFSRQVPHYLSKLDFAHIKGIIIYTTKLTLNITLIIYCLWIILLTLHSENKLSLDDFMSRPFFWAIPFLPLYTFFNSFQGFLIGRQYANLSTFLFYALMPFLYCFSIYVSLQFFSINNLALLPISFCIACVLITIIDTVIFFFIISKQFMASPAEYNKKDWLQECKQITIYLVCHAVFDCCPIIIAELFRHHLTNNEIGLYSMFLVISMIVNFTPGSNLRRTLASFMTMKTDNQQNHYQIIFDKSASMCFKVSLTLATLIYLFKTPFLKSFGPYYYQHGQTYLIPFLVIFVISCPISICSRFLSHTPFYPLISRTIGYFVIVLVVLSGLSIYYLGMWGTVISYALLSIPYELYAGYLIKTKLKVDPLHFFKNIFRLS